MQVEPGQLRQWKNDIPLLPRERKRAGRIFLILDLNESASGGPRFVHYLENQEIFEDFVHWIEQWSVKLDETR